MVEAAAIAQSLDPITASRYTDLAKGLPVGSDTLAAIIASIDAPTPILEWAHNVLSRVNQATSAHVTDVLVSSGFDAGGCAPDAFGILDPDYDGDGQRVVAVVVRRSDGCEQITASGWQACDEPYYMPYVNLRGDTLADALETISAGSTLLLQPGCPAAWLSTKTEPVLVAAAKAAAPPTTQAGADNTSVYAIVDPLNTSAVLTLFHAAPGPVITVRKAGGWAPDDGTLQAQLTGIDPPPVVAVDPTQVPDVLRQVDDFDSTHPATASGPTGGPTQKAATPTPPPAAPYQYPAATPAPDAVPAPQGPVVPAPVSAAITAAFLTIDQARSAARGAPSVAGLCVRAKDTGRVFMLQRGMDPSDPAQGKIEFPGGHIEPDDGDELDGAMREWHEETGQQVPDGDVSGSWTSSNGVYQGFVHDIPHESAINLAERKAGTNPDDPHGDSFEAALWMDPTHLANNPAVRDEVKHSMHLVHAALDGNMVEPVTAASEHRMHHQRRVREAKDSDSKFDADRAAADLSEQEKRRGFETMIGSRYAALRGDGLDENKSASVVRSEIEAENDRRNLWEQHRADALLAEKNRRLNERPAIRLSHELTKRVDGMRGNKGQTPPQLMNQQFQQNQAPAAAAMAAAAIPHTMMPKALREYWLHGKGALKIRWGTGNDWYRCRDHLVKYLDPYRAKAACDELHKLATGLWPSTHAKLLRDAEGKGAKK